MSRDRITRPNVSTIHGQTRAILACSINPNAHDDNYAYCGLLVPHIRESNVCVIQFKLEQMKYIDECIRFAHAFDRVAEWNEVESLNIIVMNARQVKLGVDCPDTLTCTK